MNERVVCAVALLVACSKDEKGSGPGPEVTDAVQAKFAGYGGRCTDDPGDNTPQDAVHHFVCNEVLGSGGVSYAIEAKTKRLREIVVTSSLSDADKAQRMIVTLLGDVVEPKLVEAVRTSLATGYSLSDPPDATVGTAKVFAGRMESIHYARIEWTRPKVDDE